MRTRFLLASAAAALMAATSAGPSWAQATGAPVTPLPPQGNAPSAQGTAPATTDRATTTGTLSDKLNQSDGVITPPANVDPGIAAKAPVPNPGSTPVIRPPGTPGGNQAIQPK